MSTANPSQPTAAALAAKAAMEAQWIESFKAGTRPADNGTVYEIGKPALRDAADSYDPTLHEAPLTIGHPATDQPAYGYVKSVGVSPDGETLLIQAHQVVPEYAEQAIEGGQLKKRSISFYHPTDPNNPKPGHWYVRHVGALGAQPPAVKGLANIKPLSALSSSSARFGEAPTVLVCFSEADSSPAPRSTPAMTPEELAALQAKAAKADQAEADAAKLRQLIADSAAAAQNKRHAANVAFAEGMCGKDQPGARLAPADKNKLVAALDVLGDAVATAATTDKPVSFAEADGKTTPFDALEFIKGALMGRPLQVKFSEYQPQGTPAESFDGGGATSPVADLSPSELDKRIKAHMAKHQGMSYAEASTAVCSFGG